MDPRSLSLGLSLLVLVANAPVPLSAANLVNRFNLQQQNAKPPPPPFPERFNFFDTDLLQSTARTVTGNFMISPASIKSTLAMLLEGAAGNCADELRQALRLPEDKELLRQQFTNYLASLEVNTPGVILHNSNRIFLSNKLTPKMNYKSLLQTVYWSDVQQLDFNQVNNAVNTINGWVNQATNGYIPYLVTPESIESDTVMILANAIFFKGTWKTAFDPADTRIKCFKTASGCRNVNMMETQDEFNYGIIDNLNARVVEIPYQGGNHSMIIFLPNEKTGLTSLIRDINQVPISRMLAELQPTDVQLTMPKFTISFEDNMVGILRNVGIQKVFESQSANFSSMLDEGRRNENPQLNNVFHKTFIQVDESGSIASAATGAMVIPLMGSSTAMMVVDHPFLFMIRDMRTGAILFQGRVEQPDEAIVNAPYPTSSPLDQQIDEIYQQAGSPAGSYKTPTNSDSISYSDRFLPEEQSNTNTPLRRVPVQRPYVQPQPQQYNYGKQNIPAPPSNAYSPSSIMHADSRGPYYPQTIDNYNYQPQSYSNQPQILTYLSEDRRDFQQQRREASDPRLGQVARSMQPASVYQSPMPKDKDGIVFYEKN